MQGFILNTNKVRDEDLIVTILTENKIYTLYRFYGVRHSTINIGFKIDFEIDQNGKTDIKRLKDVLHLGYPWILDNTKLYLWQQYLKLFFNHLKDIDNIDSFYFNSLNNLAHKLEKQNPKRAILENYIALCEFEGRLHKDFICLLCEKTIYDNVVVIRGFNLVHTFCGYGKAIKLFAIRKLFFEKNSIALDDDECEYLWQILLQGL